MPFEMSSGADLFVVCKQCGSEVSPYITECPYCGNRLRRRAPKLPKVGEQSRRGPRVRGPGVRGLRRRSSTGVRTELPYATAALVLAGAVVWVVAHARPLTEIELSLITPLQGEWWRLLSSLFLYLNGWLAFVSLSAIAIFGWLLERRHGPALVLVAFFGAGISGGLLVDALQGFSVISGGNGAALALLCAWAVPDLQAARAGHHYEGDLLGAAAIAAVLLAMPLVLYDANWIAGVVGALIGLVLGYGLSRTRAGIS
jgi:membrane associated rhomboid family serine protease